MLQYCVDSNNYLKLLKAVTVISSVLLLILGIKCLNMNLYINNFAASYKIGIPFHVLLLLS